MNTTTTNPSTRTNSRRFTPRRMTALALAGLTTATLAAAAVAGPAQAAADRDLDARMNPTQAQPTAHGHAEYDADRSGREFEIRVKGLHGLAGHRLVVRVHGDRVGKMTVHHGVAHMDRESGVPAMSAGDVIKVRASGALVSRGTLHYEVDTDD